MKIVQLDKPPLIRLLVYGDSGSGKTTLIGSAQQCKETFPLLVLNARGQPISLRTLDPRPAVLDIESMTDFTVVYNWLLEDQPMPTPDLENNERNKKIINRFKISIAFRKYLSAIGVDKFKSVALDSITHVQRIAMGDITGDQTVPGEIPPQAQIQHWGSSLRMLTKLADYFYRLPIHVMMTALTRRTEIESMGLTLFSPFLQGQSNMEIPSHAEIVGRLMNTATISSRDQKLVQKATDGTDLPYNILYTQGGRDFIAKWQGLDKPPPKAVLGPTIEKIIGYMK